MSAPHFFQTRPGLTVGELAALTAASEILVAEQLAAPGADVPAAVRQVVDGHFARAVVGK